MFFQDSEINEELLCPICAEVYSDPRLLPCGETVCNECIAKLEKSDRKNEIKCSLCDDLHPIPENGFYSNNRISRLSKKRPREVTRPSSTKLLAEKVNSTQDKIESLERMIKNGKDEIQKYCIKLRNEVNLQAEIMIEDIHKQSEELIKQINDYELECIRKYEENETSEKHIQTIE